MKNKTNKLILSVFIMGFISCDYQYVEVENPEPEKALVIEAFLVPNNSLYTYYPGKVVAELTELRSLNESYNKDTIKEALVTLTDENGTIDTLIYDTLYDDYRADIIPDANCTYTLKVVCDSFPSISAKDALPVKVDLDSVQIEPFVRVNDLGAAIGQATIYFYDPPESENYYEVEVTRGYNATNGIAIYSNDPVVTREFYYPDNIELQAYQAHRLLFADCSLGSGQQAMTFTFDSRTSSGSSGNKIAAGFFTVKFRSVSKNYYLYYTSYLDYRFNLSGDVLLGSCEPVNILGNVENGYGLFGAYQEVYSEVYFNEISY